VTLLLSEGVTNVFVPAFGWMASTCGHLLDTSHAGRMCADGFIVFGTAQTHCLLPHLQTATCFLLLLTLVCATEMSTDQVLESIAKLVTRHGVEA
jgi:hypothetical protein